MRLVVGDALGEPPWSTLPHGAGHGHDLPGAGGAEERAQPRARAG